MSRLARTIRVRTAAQVKRYVFQHGPCTARSVAFGLYGEGRTRTRARARVAVALETLEDAGELARARPRYYGPDSADEWMVAP